MTQPKPKRRWHQFSLRTLLIAVLVLSLPLGWIGWELEKTRREHVVVDRIEELGGVVEYHESKSPPWIARRFRRTQEVRLTVFPPAFLQNDQSPFVSRVNDNTLDLLKALKTTEELIIVGANITDCGMEHVAELTSLDSLVLVGTKITDKGLIHIAPLTRITKLTLSHSQTTDAGLVHLAAITSLEELHLDNTDVTDAGLMHLRELANLERLGLYGSRVTHQGVEKLRQALPNCEISYLSRF